MKLQKKDGSNSLFFMSKSLFHSFAHKNERFTWKTNERIPNPGERKTFLLTASTSWCFGVSSSDKWYVILRFVILHKNDKIGSKSAFNWLINCSSAAQSTETNLMALKLSASACLAFLSVSNSFILIILEPDSWDNIFLFIN